MHQQVFINLPVRDLSRSMSFFRSLGYDFDSRFTNEVAACLILGEQLYAMLLTEAFFAGFTAKTVVDAHQATEVLVCLSCSSRGEVDELVNRARSAGGRIPRPPQEQGFMYGHAFEDPDGHIWELVYMEGEPPPAA